MTAMTPVPYRVTERREETRDTATLVLRPCGEPIPPVRPGQFTMMYAYGVGEAPISVSRTGTVMEQTVRDVGAVSRALAGSGPGRMIGVRGPYGVGWGVEDAVGRDLVFAGGGIGLAPLRPAILYALRRRASYGAITVLIGARTPADLIYRAEFDGWRERGARVEVTVDRAGDGWRGNVGLITSLVSLACADPPNATAFICGPEVMMRFTAEALEARGLTDVRISLERNMRCGVGWCGHCQLGPRLVCRDGPVVAYRDVATELLVKER
ncbi:FAD/NAD(P)-binding protein [Actinoallomurus rhizosphaericola]|uniref:FAD/NAD(P)-binding protein n=1 Tax=Actinoallomurus rhizosphaericola TaxID=2952536 RepID=UPI0020939D60|nr:FAD/NAD(P)-binding protein [Actinoallomurus rhizosphaericola]MCO5995537.1 FAD/NAD(P)-binding protein [Actinoallomurus rhizosphaericola]